MNHSFTRTSRRLFHWGAVYILRFALTLAGTTCSQVVNDERTKASPYIAQIDTEAPPVPEVSAVPDSQMAVVSEEPVQLADSSHPRVPRTGAPGSTKGTISCGVVRCDASTHDCAWDGKGQWACVSQQTDPSTTWSYLAGCDDTSDCAALERCCANVFDVRQRLCLPRSEPELCSGEICQEGGSPCPSGTTCELTRQLHDENGIEGMCLAPADRATCAERVRCPAEKPICVLQWKSEEPPICVARNSELTGKMSSLVFRCTRQGDCKGEESCMFGARSQSAFCGRWQRNSWNSLVCDPRGKVPRMPSVPELNRVCSDDKDCREKLRCFPRVEFPWLGVLDVAPHEAELDVH